MSTIAEASKGGAPGRGKSTPTGSEEASVPRKRKSTGRMEEKLNGEAKEESRGALWERSARGSTVTRIRVVYPGNNSDLQRV